MQIWPVRVVVERAHPADRSLILLFVVQLGLLGRAPLQGRPLHWIVLRTRIRIRGSTAVGRTPQDRPGPIGGNSRSAAGRAAAVYRLRRCVGTCGCVRLRRKVRPRAAADLELGHRPGPQRSHFLDRLRLERTHRKPAVVERSFPIRNPVPLVGHVQRPVVHPGLFHLEQGAGIERERHGPGEVNARVLEMPVDKQRYRHQAAGRRLGLLARPLEHPHGTDDGIRLLDHVRLPPGRTRQPRHRQRPDKMLHTTLDGENSSRVPHGRDGCIVVIVGTFTFSEQQP